MPVAARVVPGLLCTLLSRQLPLSGRLPRGRLADRSAGGLRMAGSRASMQSTGTSVVYVTVPTMEVAEKLAEKLVNPEQRLAACVNIVPGLTSIYWWEGKVHRDAELLLVMKTQDSLVPKLTEVVQSNHPYEECEVISLPITGGKESYIQWIRDSTSS